MYDNIVGIEGRSIDNKYRIILPKYIGVCEDEKLVLIYKDKYLEVKELTSVLKELKEIIFKVEKANNLELINFYQEKKDILTSCIGSTVRVDKQNRITLGKEIVERYDLASGVMVEGVVDGFRIWNANLFLEHQSNNFNKVL